MNEVKIIDLGLSDYDEVWNLQHKLFDAMVEAKKEKRPVDDEWLIIVEHQPVVTLGKHAHRQNVLLSAEELLRRGVKCRYIERGGDVTFHGPGQIVMYPLLDLEKHNLGVKKYVELLEEAVIRTLSSFNIKGERIDGASGVWIGKGTDLERKICALGVKCSRFCTMHGLALNVSTDLNYFRMINPCGFINKGVTSIKAELGGNTDIEKVKELLTKNFLSLLS